jgi:hypothetical protein
MMELAKSLLISHFPQGWKHYSNSGLSATRVSVVSEDEGGGSMAQTRDACFCSFVW